MKWKIINKTKKNENSFVITEKGFLGISGKLKEKLKDYIKFVFNEDDNFFFVGIVDSDSKDYNSLKVKNKAYLTSSLAFRYIKPGYYSVHRDGNIYYFKIDKNELTDENIGKFRKAIKLGGDFNEEV